MIIDSFSTDLANIILYNYQSFVKFVIIFIALILSSFYLFVIKPHIQKKTDWLAIAFLRFFVNLYCIASLIISPFFFLALNPYFAYQTLLTMLFYFYSPLILLSTLLIMVDINIALPYYLANIMGLNIENPRIKRIISKLTKNTKYENGR